MMPHNNTRFGNKMFCGSEDIVGLTFTNILNLCYDLDLERSNSMFPQNTLAYDAVLQNQVWLQRTSFLEDIVKIVTPVILPKVQVAGYT